MTEVIVPTPTAEEALYQQFLLNTYTTTPPDAKQFHELPLAVQEAWRKVVRNFNEPVEPYIAAWDYYAASALDEMMPDWESLPWPEKRKWQMSFAFTANWQQPKLPVESESQALEELRQMRAYSKCFTTAYDRKQQAFVLIEQDATAWKAIAQWVVLNVTRLTERHPKIISAKATLARWKERAEGPDAKLPD